MPNANELREVLTACSLPEAIEILTRTRSRNLDGPFDTDRPKTSSGR